MATVSLYRLTRVAAGALAGLAVLGGCSRSITELGLSAHKGNCVTEPDGIPMFSRTTVIKTDGAGVTDVEQVRLFVEPAKIDSTAKGQVIYDQRRLETELTNAVEDASVKFGRFIRVTDRSKADVIVKTRMSMMVAWGDWSKTIDQLQAKYKSTDAAKLLNMTREGVDVLVTLGYYRPSGEQFGASNVTGRLVSLRGETLSSASTEYGNTAGSTEVRNAKVDETRMPQILAQAADGAFVASFEQVDPVLWEKLADPSGIRRKR